MATSAVATMGTASRQWRGALGRDRRRGSLPQSSTSSTPLPSSAFPVNCSSLLRWLPDGIHLLRPRSFLAGGSVGPMVSMRSLGVAVPRCSGYIRLSSSPVFSLGTSPFAL